MGFDGKEDFKSKFKEEQRMKEALSTKKSKTKENKRETRQDTGGNWAHGPCTQDPARPTGQKSGTAWPCEVA